MQTAQQSAPDAPQTPFYCVRRWTGKGWRAVSGPLAQLDALDVAVRLKAGGVSAGEREGQDASTISEKMPIPGCSVSGGQN